MNEEASLLLTVLSRSFHFRELLIAQWDPVLIETDRGLKRIRFWQNEQLLRNHIDWRKKLSGGSFFLDRMYVTVSGNPFIRFGRYAVTCHDAPLEPAPVRGSEPVWSEVVGTLLRQSRTEFIQPPERPVQERVASIFRRMDRASVLNQGKGEQLLRLCYPEAETRAIRCDELRLEQSRHRKMFVLPSDFRLGRSRKLLETLFVEFGQADRIGGYPQLADFFMESMENEGEEPVRQLFADLMQSPDNSPETADLLQASWYAPGEWLSLAESALRGQMNPETIETFKKTWDQKTRMISLFQSVASGTG